MADSEKAKITFDQYTVVRLMLRADAPELTEAEADELQDRHMSHTADLVAAGHLLAAGPPFGGDEPDWRGLSIYATGPAETRALCETDPAVVAGRLRPLISTWMVPSGQLSFGASRVPRSMSEIED